MRIEKADEEKLVSGEIEPSAEQEDEVKDLTVSAEELTSKPKGLTFDHYLAGGAIGFSSATFLMLAITWSLIQIGTEMTFLIQLSILVIPNIFGGALATFLFTRKSQANYLKDGVKIGIAGFIITFMISLLMDIGGGGIYILVSLIIGGCLGGLISRHIYGKL